MLYDNGLLDLYKKHAKNGHLDLSQIDLSDQIKVCNDHHYVEKVIIKGNSYYLKTSPLKKMPNLNDRVMASHGLGGDYVNYYSKPKKIDYTPSFMKGEEDRQIMAGQIYNKLGIKGAIYTPATSKILEEDGERDLVISNSIESESSRRADRLLTGFNRCPVLQLDERNNLKEWNQVIKYYTPHGIQQILKMRVADVITCCNDRHIGNYNLEFNKIGQIDDVSLFDYEETPHRLTDFYFQNFERGFMGRLPLDRMLENFKENEEMSEFIDKKELAEEILNLDIKGIASEISDATNGYEVASDEINKLQSRCESVANALLDKSL